MSILLRRSSLAFQPFGDRRPAFGADVVLPTLDRFGQAPLCLPTQVAKNHNYFELVTAPVAAGSAFGNSLRGSISDRFAAS